MTTELVRLTPHQVTLIRRALRLDVEAPHSPARGDVRHLLALLSTAVAVTVRTGTTPTPVRHARRA